MRETDEDIDIGKSFSVQEINSLYKIHRDFAEHENNLINYRMTWLITTQSFLIATFGFSYQTRYQILSRKAMPGFDSTLIINETGSFEVFLLALALIGAIAAYATQGSVRAAMDSIDRVGDNWDRYFRDLTEYSRQLPAVIGVRAPETSPRFSMKGLWRYLKSPKYRYGIKNRLTGMLPSIFVIFWIIVFAMTLYYADDPAYFVPMALLQWL